MSIKSWFHKLLRRKQVADEQTVAELPEGSLQLHFGRLNEQGVFYYEHPVVAGRIYLDPWEIDRRLRRHGDGDRWGEALDVMRSVAQAEQMPGSPLADIVQERKMQAFGDLAALSRKVFELPTIEKAQDAGWTDGQAFLLLSDYLVSIALVASEYLPLPKSLARPAA